MKYMKQGVACLLALSLVFAILPVKADSVSENEMEKTVAEEKTENRKQERSLSENTVLETDVGDFGKKAGEEAEADGIVSHAEGDIASGKSGNITWRIDQDGKLTVSGTGDFTRVEYYVDDKMAPWYEYRSQIISAEVNVSGMTDASYIFCGCNNLINVDVSGFDIANITDMSRMFYACSSLTSVDVSGFDTANVTDMSWMFAGCSSLTSVDVSGFDTANVTDMSWMFNDCSSLINIDVSGFNTTNVIDMSRMFGGCSSLINVDVSGFSTTNVTNMNGMFGGCSSFTNVDVSRFNTANVTAMSSMFSNCSSLTNVNVSGFDTINVTDMGGMFFQCFSLTNVDVSGFNTTNVTDMNGMFDGCKSLTSVNVSRFNTVNVTDMGSMFSRCINLINVDVSGFDTTNVTNMKHMFEDCVSLENVDVSGFNTMNVMDMSGMFSQCSSLTSVDVSGFNTVNVRDMKGMFWSCRNLTNIDVSGFNTMNVTNMGEMFYGCRSLIKVDVSGFDTTNVTNMNAMFLGCENLTNVDISGFDMSNVIVIWNMFTSCDSLLTIDTPHNLTHVVTLPRKDDTDIWRLPDGTEITELPRNRSDSVVITRYRNPKIITETVDLNMSDIVRIKYVPYSYTVETDNWDPDNIVTYSIEKGTLAKGLKLYPATGEIYGMPLESGTFPITVKATFSNPRYLPSYKDLTLTVLDNTDSNVLNASDPGYELEQFIGILESDVNGSYYVLTQMADQLFISAGEINEFIDFWLNGQKLAEGTDYTKESGSTRITIRRQTFENLADQNGTNTIAAEFRVDGNVNNALKRTAQNFRIDIRENNKPVEDNNTTRPTTPPQDTKPDNNGATTPVPRPSGTHSSTGTQPTPQPTVQSVTPTVTFIGRLMAADGTPLSGAIVELHSNPQTTTADANGIATFNTVELGMHTLYIKAQNGDLLSKKDFEIISGTPFAVNENIITAEPGTTVTMNITVKDGIITFSPEQPAQKTANAQMLTATPATGDPADVGVWLILMLSFGGLAALLLYQRKREA